ncbi:MAG TPA: inosine/xanthosine triphosphatase [Candidatus Paceibacterota bacterium]|nr:inosine/xanthosine triphosphatase [Candidatus Paceibacterota bacterium]
MKIVVGSRNPAKVEAVREILADYPRFKDAEIVGIEVPSGVPDQPTSFEEVTGGAVNRAQAAFIDCDYAIGLEAGFMRVPNAKSGYMNVSACAIHDGTDTHLGLSSAFETPDKEVMRLVVEEGLNFAEAANRTGLDPDPELGKKSGVIGKLTGGKINRKEYVQQSLVTALIHIDN